jgi:hypothetical protein
VSLPPSRERGRKGELRLVRAIGGAAIHSALLLLLIVGAAPAQDPGGSFLPLEAGMVLRYGFWCPECPPWLVFTDFQDISVIERRGDEILVMPMRWSMGKQLGCGEHCVVDDQPGPSCPPRRLRERGQDIDIHEETVCPRNCRPMPDPEADGFYPYLRPAENAFLRFDRYSCNNNRTATVVGRDETVMLPLGTFEGCLRLEFSASCCSHSSREECWCPGLGLASYSVDGGALFLLEVRAPQFRRGDANQDGVLQLSDAVAILHALFLGGPPPACEDALDVDDSGTLEITDAVALLGHLFLGARPTLPPPFGACGRDPTPDSFRACVYEASCE